MQKKNLSIPMGTMKATTSVMNEDQRLDKTSDLLLDMRKVTMKAIPPAITTPSTMPMDGLMTTTEMGKAIIIPKLFTLLILEIVITGSGAHI